MKILFVCLGNICRSPTAEGGDARARRRGGIEGEIEIESAGTGDWHIGAPPDHRSVAAAARRGDRADRHCAPGHAARTSSASTCWSPWTATTATTCVRLAPDGKARSRVRMLREFGDGEEIDVPDPYNGGADGFAEVVEIVERNCEALLEELRAGRLA